jgi:hypothetical protein
MRLVAVVVVCAACTGQVHSTADYRDAQPLLGPPCSVEGVTGTIPGVTLAIRSSSCTYVPGQTAHFTFEVTTDASVPGISVAATTGCSACQQGTTDPLSWVGWSVGGRAPDGSSQMYCLCDTGCCAPHDAATIQPAVADEMASFDWDVRNWNGPSDTSAPEGAYFPPGSYAVHVTFHGDASGSVDAMLPITVD